MRGLSKRIQLSILKELSGKWVNTKKQKNRKMKEQKNCPSQLFLNPFQFFNHKKINSNNNCNRNYSNKNKNNNHNNWPHK